MKIVNINYENEERAVKWIEVVCRMMDVDLPNIVESSPTCVVFRWIDLSKEHVLAGTMIWIYMNRKGVRLAIGSKGHWPPTWIQCSFSDAYWSVVTTIIDHRDLLKRKKS